MPDPLASLWQPLKLRGVELPNRVMTSAMTLQYGEAGAMGDRHAAFYRERARGGVGLILSEQLSATSLSESPFSSALRAYDESFPLGVARVVDALGPFPTRFFAQLFAAGAVGKSMPGLDRWRPVRAPSAVGVPGGERPSPLEVDELEKICGDFAASACNVIEGGAHGIEVHGSHGWLVGQFLSPFYNRRTDDFGGTVENRCRFALDLGRAIRRAIGQDVPLGITLTYDELIGDAGITPGDALAQLVVLSTAEIFDFFDISIGSSHSEHHTIAPMGVSEGFGLPFAARAKSAVGAKAAIFIAGRVVDPQMAARAVGAGHADVVAMSRAHLADPHLLRKVREGRRPTRCIGANVCVRRALENEPVACVLNPVTGRELHWRTRTMASAPQQVAVIGAGPAGLRLGAVAAERGHDVVVHERRALPGGHLRQLAALPTREPWTLSIDDLVDSLLDAGGQLRLSSNVSVDRRIEDEAGIVVVATGARWEGTGASFARPDRAAVRHDGSVAIFGIGEAIDRCSAAPAALGRRIVVVDETGEYLPLGFAELVATGGVEVCVVSSADGVGAQAAASLDLAHLLPRLVALGVRIEAAAQVEHIHGRAVRIQSALSARPLELAEIDAVIFSMLRRPRDAVYQSLLDRGVAAHRVGDVVSPRDTTAVIHEAEALARQL